MDLHISQARRATRRVRLAREEFASEFDLPQLRLLRVREVFADSRPVALRAFDPPSLSSATVCAGLDSETLFDVSHYVQLYCIISNMSITNDNWLATA